jgi:UDP-N-acetylmuramate--alanine ligase
MSRDWSGRRLHFVGIGGAGMSGLAIVAAGLGAEVTGSDRAESSYMERLRVAGLEPIVGHDAANLPKGAEVVVSSAIAADNPELALARERGVEPIHRGELLAQLCAEKRLIAVAGTHGKTTTTAMIVWALRGLGEDPAFFIGGEVPRLGPDGAAANAGWGESEWAVAEGDESDGSFLRLDPEIAVVTNVEMDHHSKWGSLEQLVAAFAEFAAKAERAVLPAPSGPEVTGAAATTPGIEALRATLRVDGTKTTEMERESPCPVLTTASTLAPRLRPSAPPASIPTPPPRHSPTSPASAADSS